MHQLVYAAVTQSLRISLVACHAALFCWHCSNSVSLLGLSAANFDLLQKTWPQFSNMQSDAITRVSNSNLLCNLLQGQRAIVCTADQLCRAVGREVSECMHCSGVGEVSECMHCSGVGEVSECMHCSGVGEVSECMHGVGAASECMHCSGVCLVFLRSRIEIQRECCTYSSCPYKFPTLEVCDLVM